MRPLLLLSLCAGLSACSTQIDAPQSETFGLAVASMQNQIVPVPVSNAPTETSAARTATAIARYEAGEVKELYAHSTSDLTINITPLGGK